VNTVHYANAVHTFGTPVPGVAELEDDCLSPDHPGARLGHLRSAVTDVEPLSEAELAAFLGELGDG
jgi:hypothetical protein